MYRPVPLASFALDWSLWKGRPVGFHLTNILLHAAVTGLVFLLLATIGAGPLEDVPQESDAHIRVLEFGPGLTPQLVIDAEVDIGGVDLRRRGEGG